MLKKIKNSLLDFKRSFVLLVGLPTIAVLLYLTFIAQKIYQTEFQLVIRENTEVPSQGIPGMAAALLGGSSRISPGDAFIINDYLYSYDFIEIAQKKLDLKTHYSRPIIDKIHALTKNPTAEEFRSYLREMISINIDPYSLIVTIQARAFTPDMSKKLADLILDESEKAINTINRRMVESRTALAKTELTNAQTTLSIARHNLLQFQSDNKIADPSSEISSHINNVAGLDTRLVSARTDLRAKEQYLQNDSFEIKTLKQEISAIEAQRQQETSALVSSGNNSMTTIYQAYENVKMQVDFALQAYMSAFALVEKSKIEASRQEKFLLVIAPTRTPESSAYPKAILGTVSFFVIACVVFGIGRLILATIRDHSI